MSQILKVILGTIAKTKLKEMSLDEENEDCSVISDYLDYLNKFNLDQFNQEELGTINDIPPIKEAILLKENTAKLKENINKVIKPTKSVLNNITKISCAKSNNFLCNFVGGYENNIYNYIKHPITKKKINIFSKLGRKIINKYINNII